jgi:pyruvate formate lyase activating enzyme
MLRSKIVVAAMFTIGVSLLGLLIFGDLLWQTARGQASVPLQLQPGEVPGPPVAAGKFTSTGGTGVQCLICGGRCRITNGGVGRCKRYVNVNGTLRQVVRGTAAAAGQPAAKAAPAKIAGLTDKDLAAVGLSTREAMYYEKLENNAVQCHLCPRDCIIEVNKRGTCNVRMNVGGTLRTLVYAKAVSAQTEPVEKKPFFHFLPGSQSFSIATAGCNLRCNFCQNWQISQALPERAKGGNLPPADVVATAKKRGAESICYTYTEPTVFYEYMLDTAKLAREQGVKNVLHTCGYINPEPLMELAKYLDAANVDLKGFDPKFYKDYCGDSDSEMVQVTIKTLKEKGVWVEITNLVIPGANDDPEKIRAMCKWIVENVGADVPLHFSAFHPAHKLRDRPPTPVDTLTRARDIARQEGIKYVYIGNVTAPDAGVTNCPACGKPVVERSGYAVTANHIKDGKCEYCNAAVPGIWLASQPAAVASNPAK